MSKVDQQHLKSLLMSNRKHYMKLSPDKIFTVDIDKDDNTTTIPSIKCVCPACDGKGTELKGGLKGLAFTQSDREEMGEHDWNEFSENMMAGNYDVACSECHGQNVIDSPDLTHVPEAILLKLFTYHLKIDDENYAAEMESAGERRMGA